MEKRMNEIKTRCAEIRGQLETGKEIDIEALDKELRSLNAEYSDLEKRQALIGSIANDEVKATKIENPVSSTKEERKNDTELEYRSAWLNQMKGSSLSETEKRALTTGTSSVGAVVPTVTQNKIIEKIKQYAPLLEKIDLLNVPGGVKIPAEGTTNEASVHTEGATITASADTMSSITLSAYEITKLVTISKSVEKMSIDAFETWLVNKLARAIANKINGLIISGTGSSQPEGINSITWGATNSITVAKAGTLSEANIQGVVALLPGGYDTGAEWLMSKATFFADFHALMNNSKNNVVTESNGTYRIMGYPIVFDDRMTAHEAILGNLYLGYVGNLSEDVTVTSQFVTRENSYDFLGCAMFDGKVQATEAFVKIVKATA